MISIKSTDCLKEMAEIQHSNIPGGVLYIIIEDGNIIWRKDSLEFRPDFFMTGDNILFTHVYEEAVREKKPVTGNIPASVYGIKMKYMSEPLFDDDGEVKAIFSTILPKMHPIAKAFKDFAPIISEMFPEGSILTFTDLEKIVYKQSSKKFDLPMQVGDSITDKHPGEIIRAGKPDIIEDSGMKSGFRIGKPLMIANYPIYDEENSDEIIGTFGIITPKEAAFVVREMSDKLESSLSGISSAVQQLAAAASDIYQNELELNREIKNVTGLSDEINGILVFIKSIADKTKMLGLNAAIEAARAGEAGSGFGVVAKEIRSLSDQSKGTVPKIKELTDSIKDKSGLSDVKSKNSLKLSQEQAAATQEVTASVEEIIDMAEKLNQIAKKL